MTDRDRTLIASLTPAHPELASLVSQHAVYEKQLQELGRHRVLSPDEQVRVKSLKRKKLRGRDRIEAILQAHRP